MKAYGPDSGIAQIKAYIYSYYTILIHAHITPPHTHTHIFRPDLSQGDEGGSAGVLRCGKASTWEGGMRVPGIAWWPNNIRHGRTHQLASTLDLLPTIFSMTGAQLPQHTKLDGVDLSSLLYNRDGKVCVPTM